MNLVNTMCCQSFTSPVERQSSQCQKGGQKDQDEDQGVLRVCSQRGKPLWKWRCEGQCGAGVI